MGIDLHLRTLIPVISQSMITFTLQITVVDFFLPCSFAPQGNAPTIHLTMKKQTIDCNEIIIIITLRYIGAQLLCHQ